MTLTTDQDQTRARVPRRAPRPVPPGAGRRLLLALAAGVGATALVVGAAQVSGAASDTRAPAPDTIVKVTGNADSGFGIAHYDGSALFPPTTSEAMAECRERPERVGRVRCRTRVTIWYRDLADLQQAIGYARSTG